METLPEISSGHFGSNRTVESTKATMPSPRSLLTTLLLALMLGVCLQVHAQAPLSFGVHPYLDAGELRRRFAPLATYLSARMNRPVHLMIALDYERHIQAVGGDQLDIAFLGPASYVETTERFGNKPILARIEAAGKPTFHGDIVTAANGSIARIEDLVGKRFAFGDPNSTMSTRIPRVMLHQAGISLTDLASYRHYHGHSNVALAVLSGDADAGAVKHEILRRFENRGLRSIAKTPEISEHLFVARTTLPKADLERLRSAMLSITSPATVAEVLYPIKSSATALVPANDGDYERLRRILAADPGSEPRTHETTTAASPSTGVAESTTE